MEVNFSKATLPENGSTRIEAAQYRAGVLNLSALLPPGFIINVKALGPLLGGM